jgi:two-component system NtrC family response regulator
MTQSRPFRLFLVDEDPAIRGELREALAGLDFEMHEAGDGGEALRKIREGPVDILVTALRLSGDADGMNLLRAVRERWPDCVSIVISAYGTVEYAVQAMRVGAVDFITKPIDHHRLRNLVTQAIDKLRLIEENRRLKTELRAGRNREMVVGESPAIRQVLLTVEDFAPNDVHVFLSGESGTGKELLARLLHIRSGRRSGPFVPVNCGAIAETLFEREMFGHEAGSFTGATNAKRGLFEAANGGTLFLDEITELTEKNQVDLLRVIEEKDVRRVGSDRRISIDVRIIAASNRDVHQLVREGRFRDDLYYRLNVLPLSLPPLRERQEDIPLMVDQFIRESNALYNRHVSRMASPAMLAMKRYRWPGNIRELRNVMERLVIIAKGGTITYDDLPTEIRSAPEPPSPHLKDVVARAEYEAILHALRESGQSREKAATLLGISVRTLRYKLNRYRIGGRA